MGRCLTISHTCFPCLPSRQVSPCVLCPLWPNDGSANASFKSGEYGFSMVEFGAILGNGYGIQGQNYVVLL